MYTLVSKCLILYSYYGLFKNGEIVKNVTKKEVNAVTNSTVPVTCCVKYLCTGNLISLNKDQAMLILHVLHSEYDINNMTT